MEIEGKIKIIFDAQTFDSGFQKREFVITTDEQYPQDIKLELYNERVSMIDEFNAGDEVKVLFNLRGKEYNGKYFVNLQAWRIEAPTGTSNSSESSNSASAPMPGLGDEKSTTTVSSEGENEFEDDLPF